MKSVDELIEIESKINDGMNNLKEKIICETRLKDSSFLLKESLIAFLKNQIDHFNWNNCE